MTSVRFKAGQGVNKDLPPNELPAGMWSDMLNMRSVDGVDEIMGGIAYEFNTPSIVPYWLSLYQTNTSRYLLYAGLTDIYCDDGTTKTRMTRVPDAVAVSSMVFVTTGAIVTVTTSVAHGLATGDTINLSANPTGAFRPSGNGNATVTVTGATTFTYNAGSTHAAGTTAASPVYRVVTSSGFAPMTNGIDDRYTGGSLNGVFILNSPKDGLYYWNGSTSTRFAKLPGNTTATTGYQADVSRPFKYFVVQLAVTMSGTKYPWRVLWSTSADPGSIPSSFDSAANNLAGFVDLASGGPLVDCLPLGDINIVYASDCRYAMQFLPGDTTNVFSFTRLPGNDGLLARGCAASIPIGHVYLTTSKDVRLHNGAESKSIAEGRVKRWLQSTIDPFYATRSFVAINSLKSEVWICFPEVGQVVCTKAAIWNWDSDTWSIRTLPSATYADTGFVPTSIATDRRMVLCTSNNQLGVVELGSTDFGTAITGTLERQGIDADDPDAIKTLHASKWQAQPSGAVLTVQHGSAMTPDAAPSYGSGISYTVGTDNKAMGFADGGRFLAVKMQTSSANVRNRSVGLDFEGGGEW